MVHFLFLDDGMKFFQWSWNSSIVVDQKAAYGTGSFELDITRQKKIRQLMRFYGDVFNFQLDFSIPK